LVLLAIVPVSRLVPVLAVAVAVVAVAVVALVVV
jgi:hypothetical protein